jgi:hypothetical protein
VPDRDHLGGTYSSTRIGDKLGETIATGGALKSAKCLFYLLSLRWKVDGTWVYKLNEINADLAIGVPMYDGSLEKIKHLPCKSAIQTLGLMICPSGSNAAALNRMRQQGQEWVDKVKASTLNPPESMVYGQLPVLAAARIWDWQKFCHLDELKGCLQRVYWQLVRRGGVR